MKTFVKRHSEFLGNVAVMMSGKVVAAGIALLTIPIVARLFTPDDFGIAAMFASLVGIVSSVASLRYGAAIVLPAEDQEASKVMSFSYRVVITVCLALAACLTIYSISELSWEALEVLGGWMWLLPIAIFMMSSLLIQESWLARHKAFKTLSTSLVVFNVSTSGSRIALGAISGSSASGLIVGYFIGLFCRFLVQFSAVRDGIRACLTHLDLTTAKTIASRYADFPKFNAPAGLIFALGQRMPVLFFGTMFSPAVAGLYAMADRLSQVPITIGATSVRRVFLPKAAEIENQGRSLQKALFLSIGSLALIGILPFTALWLFGQPASTWVLGDNWTTAGRYLEIIAPWLFMVWVTAPCNAIFVVLRKQKFWLSLTSTITGARLSSFGVAYAVSADPEWTLGAYVIASIFGNIVTLATTIFLVSRKSPKPPATSTEIRND